MPENHVDPDGLMAQLRELKERADATGADQQKALRIIQEAIDRAKDILDDRAPDPMR
jgi:hypothetical protein